MVCVGATQSQKVGSLALETRNDAAQAFQQTCSHWQTLWLPASVHRKLQAPEHDESDNLPTIYCKYGHLIYHQLACRSVRGVANTNHPLSKTCNCARYRGVLCATEESLFPRKNIELYLPGPLENCGTHIPARFAGIYGAEAAELWGEGITLLNVSTSCLLSTSV